ncbi:MAG TPA: PaaI family thioesterase [Tepidisphaeraceae bacterium]|jgi:uncharacterized protein (TIGR00369 family)
MPLLELPHTHNCLVCGRSNPHGLKLSLHVDPADGSVHTAFTPQPHHAGFESITHGGALATVLDEAMVWAATWQYKKFCLCAEMSIRFLRPALINQPLAIIATIDSFRPRMTTTKAQVLDAQGNTIAESTGKYMPMSDADHRAVVATFVSETCTREAAIHLP